MIDVSTRIGGRYRIDARLGGGGMADVFDAYDEQLNRPVALKLLRGIDDPDAARRFTEEIRLTARVNHPNIVSLFDAGEHDGSPFLVLERVTGGTLAGEMAAGPMDPRRVAEVGEQLASALSHSHAAGIVHRDVKPSNILLTPDGSVRLADFGIAVTATATRLTVTGTVAGSAGYVSPEQVLGSGAGAPSDIYALGLVLLECLTGAPPWSGTTVEVALARITADPPIPRDLPGHWQALLSAMTAREPEDRPPVDLVGFALSRLAVDEPFDAAMFAPPPPPPDRRVPAVAALSLAVLLLSGVMAVSGRFTPAPAVAAAPVNLRTAEVQLLRPAAAAPVSPAVADRALQPQQTAEAPRKNKRKAKRQSAKQNESAVSQLQLKTATAGGETTAQEPSTSPGTSLLTDTSLTDTSLPDTSLPDTTVTETTVKETTTSTPTLDEEPVEVEDPITTVKDAARILNGPDSDKDLTATPKKP